MSRRAGRVTVPLARLGAPTLLGDLETFCELPRLSSARAVTESSARRMKLEDLEGLLLGTPGLARRWMTMCLGVLFWSQEQVTRLLRSTSVQRIALLLGAWGDEVRLSQAEMAALIGADRASVNRAIRMLGEAGAVVSGYRYVRLVDPTALERVG
jgi:CRP/FNR family transcriptional regulator, cyclic AMP receptor protein